MNRLQVFYLRIAASLLVMLSVLPASAVLTHEVDTILENENNETDFASIYNETELADQEIGLNFRFLTSILQIFDLNFNLINVSLNSQVAEYPFLQPIIDGTGAGIATTDPVLDVMGSSPENLSDIETILSFFNENMAQLNSSFEYSYGMIEAANSTLGEPDSTTTPMIGDMFQSLKAMAEVLG